MTGDKVSNTPGKVRTNRATVLFVDDDADILESLTQAVTIDGTELTILTALDAYSALDIIRKAHVDVVVLDIHMPKMNGFELLEHLANLPSKPRAVVLTAQDYPMHVLRSIDLRVHAFVTKPFDLNYLEAVIKREINAAGEAEASENQHIARKHRNLRRISDTAHYLGITPQTSVRFECECAVHDCNEKIYLTIGEYRHSNDHSNRFITNPAHAHSLSGEPVVTLPSFTIVQT